jgi:cell division protein FtsL
MKTRVLELLGVGVAATAVTVSGLWVVEAKHESRQLFIKLEELNRDQERLEIDWGRLQIEQATRAEHSRIEALARERLQLTTPADNQLVVVIEPPRSGSR